MGCDARTIATNTRPAAIFSRVLPVAMMCPMTLGAVFSTFSGISKPRLIAVSSVFKLRRVCPGSRMSMSVA